MHPGYAAPIALVIAAGLLAGCGGASGGVDQPRGIPSDHTSAVVRLGADELAVPADLNPALLQDLVAELARQIELHEAGHADGHSASCYSGPPGSHVEGQFSTDTEWIGDTVRLSWSRRFIVGDHDRNGEVGLGDLVPLARCWGETKANSPHWHYASRLDADQNYEIGMGDLVPLAQHYREHEGEYQIQADFTAPEDINWAFPEEYVGDWRTVAVVNLPPNALPAADGKLSFDFSGINKRAAVDARLRVLPGTQYEGELGDVSTLQAELFDSIIWHTDVDGGVAPLLVTASVYPVGPLHGQVNLSVDFGDGSTADYFEDSWGSADVSHVYTQPGSYEIKVSCYNTFFEETTELYSRMIVVTAQ